MEKYLKNIKPKYYWLVAFLLTAITYTIAFSYMGLLKNGIYIIARSDLKQQYIPYIEYFCSVLKGEHDYWFSWNLGFGTGTALLFAYYTLSPFNLIYLILGEELAMTATAMVIVLKASTAAATFQIFIKNYLKKNYYETVLFAMMYALCGFQVCYYFNILWMDAFYMLPVIALGILKLLREKKWKLLLFSYVYVFGVNFYMGYIVGVSSFFLFLFAFFYNCRKRTRKENSSIVIEYGMSAMGALLLTAIIWLPAVVRLFQNLNENYPSFHMSECNILFVVNNLFMGQMQTLFGITPFIYCGLLTVILVPFFFVNKYISTKKKVYTGLCLGWFLCLFLIEPLNRVMHAFDKPEMFEQRFSFVFSFLLVTVACEQILCIRQVKIKLGYMFFFAYVAIFTVSYFLYEHLWKSKYNANTLVAFGINIIFGALYFLVLKKIQSKKWDVVTFRGIVSCLIMAELVCNAAICITRMEHKAMKEEDYEMWSEWEKNTYEKIKEENKEGFYRILSINNRGQNHSFLHDYHGVETFSSAEHKAVMNCLEKLGFCRGLHVIRGNGSTPVTRSLFDIKYEVCGISVIAETDSGEGYLEYEENEQTLALGYMVNEEIREYVLQDSPFENQNNLLSRMTGQDIDCFERTGMKLTVKDGQYMKTEEETYLFHDEECDGDAVFEYKAEDDGRPLYIFLSQDRYVDNTGGAGIPRIETKDITPVLENSIFAPELVPARIVQIGTDESGEYKFSIVLSEELEADYYKKAYFYYYDESEFQRAYEILKKQQWDVTYYDDRMIEGEINVTESGVMFTSIPYDEGWQVYVDGKEAEKISLLEDAFIGVLLEKGKHNVKMCYEPVGRVEGRLLSALAGAMLLILAVIDWRHKNIVKLKDNSRKM